MILLIVFLCLVVAVGAFALFGPPSRMMSPPVRDREKERAPTSGFGGGSAYGARVPHLHELPQGCLIGLILAGLVWFALWALVLVFALRFLQTPYTG